MSQKILKIMLKVNSCKKKRIHNMYSIIRPYSMGKMEEKVLNYLNTTPQQDTSYI